MSVERDRNEQVTNALKLTEEEGVKLRGLIEAAEEEKGKLTIELADLREAQKAEQAAHEEAREAALKQAEMQTLALEAAQSAAETAAEAALQAANEAKEKAAAEAEARTALQTIEHTTPRLEAQLKAAEERVADAEHQLVAAGEAQVTLQASLDAAEAKARERVRRLIP